MNHIDIKGWFDAGVAKLYSQVAYDISDDSTIVEVGVFEGKSTAYMVEQLLLYNKSVNFYAVDIWKSYNGFLRFQRNMMSCGYHPYIKPVRAPSSLAALQFKDESLDFVFIDGDHRYHAVRQDIISYLPKVKPGCILAGHDFGAQQCEGVKKALDEILGPKSYDVWNTSWVYYKE